MDQRILGILAGCCVVAGIGCAGTRPRTAADGQAVFASLQQAVASVGKKVEPSLAFIKIEKGESADRGRNAPAGMGRPSASATANTTGIVLTPKGHILIPGIFKSDDDNRITVFIGENEFTARVRKSDDALGMTILKIDSGESLIPLDFSSGADLAVGEWAVVLRPTDESADYQKLASLVVCQGEMAGRYRRFILAQSAGHSSGAVVVNLAGEVTGIMDAHAVLAINDLRDDLKYFVDEATGANASDEEKKKKAWFGAIVEPINKDYAKARNLSPSSLWVLHAAKDGPAAKAGVRDGDLITAVHGKPLRLTGSRLQEYFRKTLHPQIGRTFAVTVLRAGKPMEFQGTFLKAPEPANLRAEDLGVTVTEITDNEVFSSNLPTDQGVVVTDVQRGSPAATSGSLGRTLLSRGDVITELDGKPTPTLEAFSKALEIIRQAPPPVVLVKYARGLLTGYAGLNLAIGEKNNGDKQ